MMSAEMSILLLNTVIIVLVYTWLYPKVADKNLNKIALFDCLASGLAVMIVASKYWGSDIHFEFFMFTLNWFWFTFLSYSIIEIPIALWYFRSSLTKGNSN
ncbi:hypothetical protein [Colwellia piezophila]|uniref:hypothetical protein n=1 Tax=Colwellia piezophila TaxID=211668 RepID=UPI0004766C32|nr:hypothetical protein [Colwellia piezophila]